MLSAADGCELSTTTGVKTTWKKFKEVLPVLSSCPLSFKTRGHVYSSCVRSAMLHASETGHWQSQTSNVCREMTGQWSDRSAMSSRKTLSPPDPVSYLHGLALRIWTSFWRREGFAGMDMWNAPMVQSRQPLTCRLMESMGLGGQRWHGSSWQRGIAESGSSRLSTLMIDIPGDLVWDLPYVQQASYLEGAHWCGCCPCTCMLIKNPLLVIMMIFTRRQDLTFHEIVSNPPGWNKKNNTNLPSAELAKGMVKVKKHVLSEQIFCLIF